MNPIVTLDYPRSPVTAEVAALQLPRVMKARQRFVCPEVDDIAATVRAELDRVNLGGRFKPGAKVAITVGSRGISSIAAVAAAIVAEVRRLGGDPFIVPSMGSHGGATAEGQIGILAEIGVTEQSVGAPIKATMDVVEMGTLPRGMPVYMDAYAYAADAIILLNRVKPHAPWGHIGSGLMKVSTIGLGKQRGCNTIHAWTVSSDQVYHTIAEGYEFIRQRKPIILGVGIVDNAFARPAKIVALTPDEIPELERGLRREAGNLVGRLPFDNLDVFVIDEMGKNTSPGGVEPLVIGRPQVDPHGKPIEGQPKIKKVVVLDLTPQSHGNAIGLGSVDVTTRRLASKINFYDTYMNSISACSTDAARLPMVLPNDREALQIAMLACGVRDGSQLRLARAQNTLRVADFYLSEALVPELANLPNVEPLSDLAPLAFDDAGNLF